MRKAWAVAVCVVALGMMAVPAGAQSSTVPAGLGGCRQLIGAQNPSLAESSRTSLGGSALSMLGTVKDKKLAKILGSSTNTIPRLLDWCGAKYPLSKLLGVT